MIPRRLEEKAHLYPPLVPGSVRIRFVRFDPIPVRSRHPALCALVDVKNIVRMRRFVRSVRAVRSWGRESPVDAMGALECLGIFLIGMKA